MQPGRFAILPIKTDFFTSCVIPQRTGAHATTEKFYQAICTPLKSPVQLLTPAIMTRSVLCAVLLCSTLPFLSYAQPYESVFGTDSTRWRGPFCQLDQHHYFDLATDSTTTLNGMSYHFAGWLTDGTIDDNDYPPAGLLREDTQTGRAWMYGITGWDFQDTLEYLVMDLSLQVGDTFMVYSDMFGDETATVDSVYTKDARKHVRTTYQNWSHANPLTFIEGIGTNYGFGYMHDPLNLCSCIRFYWKDGVEVYFNSECNLQVGIDDAGFEQQKLRVWPNPSAGAMQVAFDNPHHQQAVLTLYNALGQQCGQWTTQNSTLGFEVAPQQAGVHLLSVRLADGNHSEQLVVLE